MQETHYPSLPSPFRLTPLYAYRTFSYEETRQAKKKSPKALKDIAAVQENEEGDKDDGVESVEDSAMSWDDLRKVLLSGITLDAGCRKVSNLSENRSKESHDQEMYGGDAGDILNRKTQCEGAQRTTCESPKGTLDGLLRAHPLDQLVLPEEPAGIIGHRVTNPGDDEDGIHKIASVWQVVDQDEITEQHGSVDESDDGYGHVLEMEIRPENQHDKPERHGKCQD